MPSSCALGSYLATPWRYGRGLRREEPHVNDDLFTDTVRIRDFDTAMRQALLDAG